MLRTFNRDENNFELHYLNIELIILFGTKVLVLANQI